MPYFEATLLTHYHSHDFELSVGLFEAFPWSFMNGFFFKPGLIFLKNTQMKTASVMLSNNADISKMPTVRMPMSLIVADVP